VQKFISLQSHHFANSSVAKKDLRGRLFQMLMRSVAKGPGKLAHSLVYLVPYNINRIKVCVTREGGDGQVLGYCVLAEPDTV
jgi:hypothetical protein